MVQNNNKCAELHEMETRNVWHRVLPCVQLGCSLFTFNVGQYVGEPKWNTSPVCYCTLLRELRGVFDSKVESSLIKKYSPSVLWFLKMAHQTNSYPI